VKQTLPDYHIHKSEALRSKENAAHWAEVYPPKAVSTSDTAFLLDHKQARTGLSA
jgi:hypothetical protein